VDLILLDWTRMGCTYCVAGAVCQGGGCRIVRPLLAKGRDVPVRNFGWSRLHLDGHRRWEVMELLGPEPAAPEPPHLEDHWVKALRPRSRSATPDQRRAILAATAVRPGEPAFGVALTKTRTALFLAPGCGLRSLATLVVPSRGIRFRGLDRLGSAGPDIRVQLNVHGPEDRWLPVKDHPLLARAEAGDAGLDDQVRRLDQAVRKMGDQVAVRLGLSRPFQGDQGSGPLKCWLMADGFFSWSDPQP
jgi:hypothetical protein